MTRREARAIYASKRWQQVRIRRLVKTPICERCDLKLATICHHVKPLRKGGSPFHEGNLQSVCKKCHDDIHTPEELRAWKRLTKERKGVTA